MLLLHIFTFLDRWAISECSLRIPCDAQNHGLENSALSTDLVLSTLTVATGDGMPYMLYRIIIIIIVIIASEIRINESSRRVFFRSFRFIFPSRALYIYSTSKMYVGIYHVCICTCTFSHPNDGHRRKKLPFSVCLAWMRARTLAHRESVCMLRNVSPNEAAFGCMCVCVCIHVKWTIFSWKWQQQQSGSP